MTVTYLQNASIAKGDICWVGRQNSFSRYNIFSVWVAQWAVISPRSIWICTYFLFYLGLLITWRHNSISTFIYCFFPGWLPTELGIRYASRSICRLCEWIDEWGNSRKLTSVQFTLAFHWVSCGIFSVWAFPKQETIHQYNWHSRRWVNCIW